MLSDTSTPTHSPKNLRPFFLLWAGQAISLLGSQAVQFALVWWLTVETGSAVVLASATLVAILPRALAGAFIGTLVDRWSRRTVMLVSDSALAVAAALLAVIFAAGIAHPGHVLVLLAVRAVGSAFHEAAMLATTTLMVPEESLTRIQGLNQALHGLMLVVAPPLGALLIASLPMAAVLGVDVVTAVFAIVPLLIVAVPDPERAESAESSLWRETLEGFRYLSARAGHLALLAIAALLNLLLAPAFSLLPLLLHEQGSGVIDVGWASACLGIGLLLGGVVLGAWGGFERRIATVLTGLVAMGVAVLAIAALPGGSLPFFGALLLVGATSSLVNGPIHALLQATIPPELQGRVFALYGSLATLAAPLGLAVAGPVAETLGVASWYLAGGVVAVVLGLAGFGIPALGSLEPAAVEEPRAA